MRRLLKTTLLLGMASLLFVPATYAQRFQPLISSGR